MLLISAKHAMQQTNMLSSFYTIFQYSMRKIALFKYNKKMKRSCRPVLPFVVPKIGKKNKVLHINMITLLLPLNTLVLLHLIIIFYKTFTTIEFAWYIYIFVITIQMSSLTWETNKECYPADCFPMSPESQ
jgi:hypothetical protein